MSANDSMLDDDWNGPAALIEAVTYATREWVEPDPVESGQVVAVQCSSKADAKRTKRALTELGFEVQKLKHDGIRYVWISDLRGTLPEDAIFEIGWHDVEVGTIPDPRVAS